MPKLAFFVGKGGVGKTTIASGYATTLASENSRNRVLLISTDPAHSLADVFQKKLGDSAKRVSLARGKLWAWELNASASFREFLRPHKEALLEVIERGSLFSAAELEPLLDTALPGMSEMAALIAIRDAFESRAYSHIVVDTAPFGHTLRLFGLPEQFAALLRFLELATGRDRTLAEHFGGRLRSNEPQLLQDWRAKLEQISQAFSASEIFLVTTSEKFSLNESVRCLKELCTTNPSLRLKAIVVNRTVSKSTKCPTCRRQLAADRKACTFLRKNFSACTLHMGEDHGFPVLGANALRLFGEHVFACKKFRLKPQRPKTDRERKPRASRTTWPELDSRLSFVLGKGGVGKTTVSAALGFATRKASNTPVQICSVDPAPSLDDIFEARIGDTPIPVLGDKHFRASELDSIALYKTWVEEIRAEVESSTTIQSSGAHIDLSFERQLLSALLDIVPPGLDEILAIFRITDLHAEATGRVIIDMAPTGHALELLRTPERIVSWSRALLKSLASHRKLALAQNAAVRIAELELRARELASAFENSGEAGIFSVMLAEPLPDCETERLFDDLHRLGFKPKALFVNRIIFANDAATCPRCRIAAEWQASILLSLRKRSLAPEIFVIPNFPREIAGATGLSAITRELWRLN